MNIIHSIKKITCSSACVIDFDKVDYIVKQIQSLTLLEADELVKQIEIVFSISNE